MIVSVYQKEVNVISEVLQSLSKLVVHYFEQKNYQVSYKSSSDPLTQVDLECNLQIVKQIRKYFPNDSILSEEVNLEQISTNDIPRRETAERIWIIDPVDGTNEFINSIPEFAISIGLIENNKPVLGFVYNPVKDFFVYGGTQMGIYLNHESLTLSPNAISSTDDIRICLSRSEMKKNLFNKIFEQCNFQATVPVGSIAYKLALVAINRFDLIISLRPKNEWDIAGGTGILNAIGYLVLDLDYQPIVFNKKELVSSGIIAGSPQAIEAFKQKNVL